MFPTSSTDAEAEEDELEATVSEVEVSRSWQEGEEGPYVESPDSSSPRAQARSVMSSHARPVTQLAPNMTHPSQTTSPQKRKAQPITSFSPRTLRAAGRAAGSVEPPDFTQRTRGFSRTISAPVSNLDPERDSFGDESNDVKRLKPRQRLELLTTGPSAKRTLSRSSKMHDKAYSGDTVLPAQNSEPYFLAASHQDRTNDIAVGIVHPEAVEHQGERLQVEDAIREEDEVQNPSGQINREELLDHDEDVMVSQISKSLGGEEEEVGQDSTPILQPTYINSSLPARSSQVPSDPPDQTLTSSQDRNQRHTTDFTPRRYIISDDESEMEDRSILFTLTPRTTDQAIARPAASPSHPPIINGHFGNLPSSGAPSERFPSQIFDGSINGFGYDDESPREVQMAATQAVLQPTYSTQRSSDTVNAAPSHALPSPKVASKPVEPGSASTAASRASNIPANRQLTRRSRPPTEPAISEISMKVHTVRRQTETTLPQQVPRSAPLPTTSRLGLEPTQVSPPATVPLAPHVDEPRHNIASGEVNGGNPADEQPQTATVDGVDTPGPPGQTTAAVPSLSASEKPVDHAPPTQVVAQNGVISGVETAAVLAHVRESPTPTEVEPSSSRPSTPSPRDRRHPNYVAPNGLAEATYQNTFRSLPPPPPSSRPTPTKQYGKRKLPSAGERRKDQVQPLQPVSIEAVETIENEESEAASASPKVFMSKVTEESAAGNPTTACEPDAFNNIEHLEQLPPSSPIPVPRPPKRRSRPSVRAQEAMEDMEMLSDVSSGSTPPPPEDYTYQPTPKNGRKGKKANGQGKSKAASPPPSDVSEEESEDSTVDEESTPLRPAKKRKLTGTNSAKLQRVSKSAVGKAIAEEETLNSELSPTTEEDSEDNTYRPVKRKGGSRPKRGPQPPVPPLSSTEVAGPVKNNKPNAPKGKSKAKPKTARNIAQRAKSKSVTTSNAEAGPSRGRSAASTELSAPPTMTSADTFTSLPVLAYWHGAQRYWFAGTAVGYDARSGMIRVDYADKTEADVAIDHLRLLRFSKGDQVRCDARSFPDRNFTVRMDWTNNIAGVEIVQETGVPSNRISLPDLYVRDKIVRRDWQDRIVSPEDLGLPNTIHLATSATKKSNSLAGKCFLLTVSGTGSATIRREMEKSIKERGGHIVNDWPALFELPDDGFGSTLATDVAPFLIVHGNELAKPKMVAALASGIPCLASSFVEDASQVSSNDCSVDHVDRQGCRLARLPRLAGTFCPS